MSRNVHIMVPVVVSIICCSIETLADTKTGSLSTDQFAAITTMCGLASFFETRLVEHARHACSGPASSATDSTMESCTISAVAFAKMWRTRLYPLDSTQQMFR